jgi:hypothetical protein
MPLFQEANVSHTKLLLDPNNFRFQDDQDFVEVSENRFAEQTVQAKAFERLRNEALLQLKNSILRNGFLPFERLVVRPYGNDRYVVIEGNRRLAALQWIASDIAAGAEVPDSVQTALNEVPVVIVPENANDPALREALMGIRHVSGIREWGGYQRAQLVSILKDKYGLESNEIAQRLAMTAHEVNRRYRAFKALRQMMKDEEYGEHARPDMYPMFHEAISLPVIKSWLGWNEEVAEFQNHDELIRFYQLMSPTESGEGKNRPPKISSYAEVRELRNIMENVEARKVLFDPEKQFVEAAAVAKLEEIARSWKAELAEAISALESIGALELKRLNTDDIELLTKLRETTAELLLDIEKLRPKNEAEPSPGL